jgi:uncharacterized protein (TIGR00369 family)
MSQEQAVVELAEMALSGFGRVMGLDLVDADADRVELSLKVRPELLQPHGIIHGGVHCAIVETAASAGAALWWGDRGRVVGVSNQTDFLRAVRDGTLSAVATPVHRGRMQQLWLVEIRDANGRLVSRGQVRLQNLGQDHPAGRAPEDEPR